MGLVNKNSSIILVTVVVVVFNLYLSSNIFQFFLLDTNNSYSVFKLVRKILLFLTLSSINYYLLNRILKFFFYKHKRNSDQNDV